VKRVLFVSYLTDFSCNAGDKIYSVSVINELKKKYKVDVLGFFGEENVGFSLGGVKHSLNSLLSVYPSAIYIYKSDVAEKKLQTKIKECDYDFIVFDHFRVTWMLACLSQEARSKSVYMSHNIETLSRIGGFRLEKNIIKKAALWLDYIKTQYWESKCFSCLNFCTAISETDRDYLIDKGIKKTELLKPGYSGDKVVVKDFALCENSVAWVGSFKYFAKKINLISFCEVVHSRFGKNVPFTLLVIGLMEHDFELEIRSRFPFCNIYPNVDFVSPYLTKANCGIVFEPVGGGFKLKILDYVFSKIPVVALRGTCDGVDFKNNVHYLEVSNADDAINAILNLLNDERLSKSLSEAAYDLCEGQFNWSRQVECFERLFGK
jgi:glycosyltransferase involved in cell wall biosynthesis